MEECRNVLSSASARDFLLTTEISNRLPFVGRFNASFFKLLYVLLNHYNAVIMGSMASQITSLTIVYSTVYSRRRSTKTSKLGVTGLYAGNSPVTGEFPVQRASNAENASIWWRVVISTYCSCIELLKPNPDSFTAHDVKTSSVERTLPLILSIMGNWDVFPTNILR